MMIAFQVQENGAAHSGEASIILQGVDEYAKNVREVMKYRLKLQSGQELSQDEQQTHRELEQVCKSLHKELCQLTAADGFTCPMLLEDAVEAALNTLPIDDSTREAIKASPVMTLLPSRWIEIVKNTIDSFVEKYAKLQEAADIPIPFLNIQISATNAQVSVSLSDNGLGFPKDILPQITGKESQLRYADRPRAVRDKHKQANPLANFLLGGQGLGLQQLIKNILTGTTQDSRTFLQKKQDYNATLLFENKEDGGGAYIKMTTPITPLKNEYAYGANSFEFSPISPMQDKDTHNQNFFQLPSKESRVVFNPSPVTSTGKISSATTLESLSSASDDSRDNNLSRQSSVSTTQGQQSAESKGRERYGLFQPGANIRRDLVANVERYVQTFKK